MSVNLYNLVINHSLEGAQKNLELHFDVADIQKAVNALTGRKWVVLKTNQAQRIVSETEARALIAKVKEVAAPRSRSSSRSYGSMASSRASSKR